MKLITDLVVIIIIIVACCSFCQAQFLAPYELTYLYSPKSYTNETLTTLPALIVTKVKRTIQCGSEIRRQEGWIQSPNYPNNYPDSVYCVYTVHRFSFDVCRVEVRLNDFDLQDTRPLCNGDYLDIGTGTRMCGVLIPDAKFITYFGQGVNSFNIIFHSDSRSNRKGFLAHVQQIPNSCGAIDDLPGIRLPGQQNIGRNVNRIGTGRQVVPSFQQPNQYGSCDVSVTGYTGYIRSPGWPSDYPPNSRCVYTIRRPFFHVCQVEIEMSSFSVHSDGYNNDRSHECHSDFLELPDRSRLCGYRKEKRTFTFPSNSDHLNLLFKSDSSESASGFNIAVRQIPYSCDIYQLSKENKCDQRITGTRSRLRSPGYPNYYGPKEHCVYIIEKANPTICSFVLDFIRFSLEPSRDRNGLCNKDYLHLPDGDRLCGEHSGRKSFTFPSAVNRTTQLFFSSDGYKEDSGFDILINQIPCGSSGSTALVPDPYSSRRGLARPTVAQAIPDSSLSSLPVDSRKLCNKLVNSQLDIIRSPNYPQDYPPLSQCSYIIHRSSADVCEVKLQFVTFDLEKSVDCQTDYLLIEATNEKYCGRERSLPDKTLRFPYNSDNLRLNFISNGVINRPGFEIRVNQLRNSCFISRNNQVETNDKMKICDSSKAINGVFRSNNYPAPYGPNVDCLYRIEKFNEAVCRVNIMLSDFSVGTWERRICINDFLEIDGKRYCGYRRGEKMTIEFPVDRSTIDLHFKTDSTDHYGGFRIDFIQETDGCSWSQPTRQLTPPLSACKGQIFGEVSFQITSPGIERGGYQDNLDCGYLIRKSSFDVCALQIKFNVFDLEQSPNCYKDYLEVGGVRVCGKLPLDSVRTYEFGESEMLIKFHSDSSGSAAGFLLTLKQIKC